MSKKLVRLFVFVLMLGLVGCAGKKKIVKSAEKIVSEIKVSSLELLDAQNRVNRLEKHLDALKEYIAKQYKKDVSITPFPKVYFAFDSYAIDSESASFMWLDDIHDILASYPQVEVSITGHADNRGSDDYNIVLGWNRAETVRNWLVNKGIDSSRIVWYSQGERDPFCIEGDNEICHAQNRVVVVEYTN